MSSDTMTSSQHSTKQVVLRQLDGRYVFAEQIDARVIEFPLELTAADGTHYHLSIVSQNSVIYHETARTDEGIAIIEAGRRIEIVEALPNSAYTQLSQGAKPMGAAAFFKFLLANPQIVEEAVQLAPEVVDAVSKLVADIKAAQAKK